MGNGVSREARPDPNAEISLAHFNLLRAVGRGSFGKVRIVERRDSKRLYALKYISKVECVQMDALKNVLRERLLLEAIDHPLLVNLRFAFQDDDNMYMCLDLMLGGDLRFHITRRRFVEGIVRFWIAEVVCALRYLHNHGIVHRDIKPDNLLLDERGHVHITDFNIATKLSPGCLLQSHSGTYSYMAPEMLLNTGYDTSVDYWSLGVVFYECIYGMRPFRYDDAKQMRHAIRYQEIRYPVDGQVTVSSDCLSAMQSFLQRDVRKRLGCNNGNSSDGFRSIQQHPYFRSFDWTRLEHKQLDPPFVPDSDRSNFDITYDLEELLLEQNPLDARPKRKTNLAKMGKTKEMELIERKFKLFDYLQYERYQAKIIAQYSSPVLFPLTPTTHSRGLLLRLLRLAQISG
ncbi:kinase-like protein [Ramicandelaber brevisporus]|nr:kinase-like protein [Ramicandelaber brevisporus]